MADGLRIVAVVDIGPHSHGGLNYAGPVVVMGFPRLRPSRGWRRHVRRMKARHG